MDDVIDRIAAQWDGKGTLLNSLSSADLARLKAAPAVQDAYSRLCKEELSLAELATDTARGKLSEAWSRGPWQIVLIKDYITDDKIVLSPYPTVLIPFNDRTLFQVRSYALGADAFEKSRVAPADLPELVADETVTFGKVWMTPRKGVAPCIRGAAEGATILAINGPAYAPYAHEFDPAMRYVGSSFSSNVYTGRVFFSDLLKQSAAAGLAQHLSRAEAARIRAYIRDTVLRRDSISEEIWPLVQSMSSFHGGAAVELLVELGTSGHELAPAARATLIANGIDPHVSCH